MRLLVNFILLITVFVNTEAFGQASTQINPQLLNKIWSAKWITIPDISGREYGVYHFRKSFQFDSVPKQFIIHVSADNRYKLYVNGQYVCNGPARGDLMKWYFETIDIAPYLNKDENIIGATVWNFSYLRPHAQFSDRTCFIIQGNSDFEIKINTDKSWSVLKDTAYELLEVNLHEVGPGEKFNGNAHPWGWLSKDFDATQWSKATEIQSGFPLLSLKEYGSPRSHLLLPRNIPQMEMALQHFSEIRRSDIPVISETFLSGDGSITIPANRKVKILFDQGKLTNAYPVLEYQNGINSEIKLTYAESLVDDNNQKGNRNVVDGKHIIGYQDLVISNGGPNQFYQTLWFRTFRYVELEIETKDEPLIINKFHSIFTGYPLQEKASFQCDDPVFSNIWKVGWHTQRLCAVETFFDCPYYEQLQYVGDTRIQSLVTYYVSGDTMLMRNAISSFNDSRLSFGLTQSRYPTKDAQIIPPFSLLWIAMISDYQNLCNDKEFVKAMLPGIVGVLQWYESKIDSTGMVGPCEWWNFVDWVYTKGWHTGIPPGVEDSHSSIINLQFVYALHKASEIFEANTRMEQAKYYSNLAEKVKLAVYRSCFDKGKGLIADMPEKTSFSQHANILAVLTNTVNVKDQKQIMEKVLSDKSLAQCTYYFRFYLAEAMGKAGIADQYVSQLEPWKQMLDLGLTTFSEEPEPARSDCHAWSASPLYYLLSMVAGIKPNEPGFKSVKIEPNPGKLKWIEATMPHIQGDIQVSLKTGSKNELKGKVILPENLSGKFLWKGNAIKLKTGVNIISLKAK
jgi:hypothetical protein